MSNLKKTLSKSRERLYDAKLGMSTSREDLLTCKNLSQSVEALTALSQLHQNGALYKSCNNIFLPMIHHVKREDNMPDRMYKSLASIDQIPGNDLSKKMGYFESRFTGDDDYNDIITRRNTNLNTVISESSNDASSRLSAHEEAKLVGLRGYPCRGGRGAEGCDRVCTRHSHKQPEPQATQRINKMSKADKMKKDAQRRRKEREQREKERIRKNSLTEMRHDRPSNEGSTSPTIRRGSVCHVEQRLLERHERLMERQEREGRRLNANGSRRLSSIESDKSPGPDTSKPSNRRKSTSLAAKKERSRSITPTRRRRTSKAESPKSSDVSEASSMESVSGSLENIHPRLADRRRKSKQYNSNRSTMSTSKNLKSNDENGNVIQEAKTTEITETVPSIAKDVDEAYNSLEESCRDLVAEEEKSDEDADSVESDKTCTGSVVECPTTPTEANEILITATFPSQENSSSSDNERVEPSECEEHETKIEGPSLLVVPSLVEIQEEPNSLKYSRSTSTTSDLGGSICEENEEQSDQCTDIENKILESKSRMRSKSVVSKPCPAVVARIRNRSNSVVNQPTVTDRARPWGDLCSGSVAKALRNFTVQEADPKSPSDVNKRRQSSPPRVLAEELESKLFGEK